MHLLESLPGPIIYHANLKWCNQEAFKTHESIRGQDLHESLIKQKSPLWIWVS